MTFEEARAQFPVFERYAYLNAGTNGPLARATVEAMAEFNRRDLEHPGQRLSGALPQGEHFFEVSLTAAALLEVTTVELRHRLDRRARERAVRAGVQVRVALEDRELSSGLLEGHATRASTGV